MLYFFDDTSTCKPYTMSLPDTPGTFPPDNALRVAPAWRDGVWPVLNVAEDGWDHVEDHRQHLDATGTMTGGTPFWLPAEGDDWQSQERTMTALGPLPEGALLSPPSQTLDELKAQKRQAFAQAFTTIEQRAQRPQSTVLAALMYDTAPPEPDADFIWQIEAIKTENRTLLAQLEAATTLEAATAIKPWLPWEQQGSI